MKTGISRIVILAIALGVVAQGQGPLTAASQGRDAVVALVSSTVVPIAAGEQTSLALTSAGTVISWGSNFFGQTGKGTTNKTGCTCDPFPTQIPGLSGVTAVVGGYDFNFVIKSDQTLWGFGENSFGQLGDGSFTSSASPVQVQGLSGVVAAAASYETVYAIESNQTLWAWGKNDAGQVGNGTQTLTGCICVPTPTQVPGLNGVIAVAASGENVMALTSDGTVWAWGDNAEGEVGNGTCSTATFDNVFSPFHIPGLAGITAIAATTGDSYALASDHTVWDWGGTGEGQLGRPAGRCSPAATAPGQIPNFTGVQAIAATKTGGGFAFTAMASAIMSDGTLWAWGDNNGCELGNGTDFNSPTPIQVPGLTSVVAVADGDQYSLAERSDGTLWAWGDNRLGSLGDGTTGPYNTACGDPNARGPFQTSVTGLALGSGGGTAPSFIYVALGDSYSSGEGNPPFEDGANYSAAVAQQNTYTFPINGLSPNSCHRSLIDYAKLSAPNLAPGSTTLLVDRTCSGAQIVPPSDSTKGPIVPTLATNSRPDDQMTDAINRLNRDFGGKRPTDVNFVSVTMGGNDADFGDLIKACLFPNLIRQLFAADSNAPGEIGWLLNHFFSCRVYDNLLFHTQDKINALPGLETQAQTNLSAAFPNARVSQLTYPIFVPSASGFPGDSCGGILRQDANYARGQGQQIDASIRATGATTTTQTGGRFQVVDLENAFGPNALCPTDPTKSLMNSVSQAAINRVIGKLTAPGSQSRALLDNFSAAYTAWRNCIFLTPAPVNTLACVPEAALMAAAGKALFDYFSQPDTLRTIQDGFGTGPNPQTQLDTSQFNFHPNAAGWRVMACNMTAAFEGVSASSCLPTLGGPLVYQFNGASLTSTAPQLVTPGVPIPFVFNGFDPGSSVTITVFSTAVSVGSITSDSAGVASGSVTLPAVLNPGVHRLTFQGTNNGGPRSIDVFVQINGRPRGADDYGVYFPGFTQDTAVDISYLGFDWGVVTPDEDGGVYVDLPLPTIALPTAFGITATGLTTGKVATQNVSPAPSAASVWAGGGPNASLNVVSSGIKITGFAHSDGTVNIAGHGLALTGGVEYGTTVSVSGDGNAVSPGPIQIAPGGEPLTINIADWRPGGSKATQLGDQYQAVPVSACSNGVWQPAKGDIHGAVVYVPCSVDLSIDGLRAGAIIAEGSITVDAKAVQLNGTSAGFSLASGAAGPDSILITGNAFTAAGPLWSAGGISLKGQGEVLSCGVYGASISVTGSGSELDTCSPPQ